jgi:hypothetical protein
LSRHRVSPALGRMFMARPSGGPWRFLGFWCGSSSISRGRSAPRQPATLPNRLASLQEVNCARRQRRCCCSAVRPHRRDEGVNHFSAGHFLTHHSQPDCGGEGTPRLSPLLWSAMGLPGMVFGSAVHLFQFRRSSCGNCCAVKHFIGPWLPSPPFSVVSAMPTGGTGNGADQ